MNVAFAVPITSQRCKNGKIRAWKLEEYMVRQFCCIIYLRDKTRIHTIGVSLNFEIEILATEAEKASSLPT